MQCIQSLYYCARIHSQKHVSLLYLAFFIIILVAFQVTVIVSHVSTNVSYTSKEAVGGG